jgi:hypothetical protein
MLGGAVDLECKEGRGMRFAYVREKYGYRHPRLDRQIEVLTEHSKTGKEGNAQETGESRKGRI